MWHVSQAAIKMAGIADSLGTSLVATGSDQAIHIGFHEKLQDGFRQRAEKNTAVGLLHHPD